MENLSYVCYMVLDWGRSVSIMNTYIHVLSVADTSVDRYKVKKEEEKYEDA